MVCNLLNRKFKLLIFAVRAQAYANFIQEVCSIDIKMVFGNQQNVIADHYNPFADILLQAFQFHRYFLFTFSMLIAENRQKVNHFNSLLTTHL